tara:strand:- start:1560 stop:1769 length:210 start_codon:yes stop_codon:yes gene_type:complete
MSELTTNSFENRLTLRKGEAARALGVSERTLHDLLKSGQIGSFKLGRAVLIPVAEIKAFISLGIQSGGK